MVTGLENNIISSFQSFAERQSTLSIVFFGNHAHISWRLPDRDIWSEVISLPFNLQRLSLEHIQNLKKYTAAFQKGRNKVSLAISSKQYAIVPAPLFDKSRESDYLVKNTGISTMEIGQVHSVPVSAINSYFTFNVPSSLLEFINTQFPTAKIVHEKVSIINGLFQKASSQGRNLSINFCNTHFDIAIFEQKKLRFFNSFNLINTEDVLYYLLFVSEKHNRNIRDYVINIYGEIPPVIDKEILVRHLPISSDFKSEDQFLSLKNLHRCE